jgi:hypothetical protein
VTVQHGGLTVGRWSGFPFDQQVLMIGNEMNRAAKLMAPEAASTRLASYERVLALVDLTIQLQQRPARRRELLRWRDLIAGLFIAGTPDPAAHAAAFRCLLRFTPAASAQIPFVLPSPSAPSGRTAHEGAGPERPSS